MGGGWGGCLEIILCRMSRRSRGRGAVDPEKLSIAKSGAPRAIHPDTILVVWEGFHHYPRLVPMFGAIAGLVLQVHVSAWLQWRKGLRML